MTIRVMIADDHAMVRSGFRRLIEAEDGMEVVGEAATGREAVEIAARERPHVVLMDIAMPDVNGIEATRDILSRVPDARVLVLTMHDERAFVDQVLEAGAAGYLLKKAADADLIHAIRSVHGGEVFVDPTVARPLISRYVRAHATANRARTLSPREREVLRLVAWGYTTREIADRLVVSAKTVESHRARLMDKLDLRTRAALVRHAKEEGLLDTPPE